MMNKELEYQDLVQRRQNLIEKIDNIEKGWVKSIPRLYQGRLQDLFGDSGSTYRIVSGQDDSLPGYFYGFTLLSGGWWLGHYTNSIADREEIEEIRDKELIRELDRLVKTKEKQVKHEMKRFDSEWIGKVRDLHQTEKHLREVYQSHLKKSNHEYDTKKAKIEELKRSFPYLRENQGFLAWIIDSSYPYVNQFKLDGEEFTNDKIPKRLKQRTRERDNNRCVRCGCNNGLHIHHIIPLSKGGGHELKNLVTLCEDCHRMAHMGTPQENGEIQGMNYSQIDYKSVDEFWNDWKDS